MPQFVMIVHVEVKSDGVDDFIEAAKKQAEHSVGLEPGCHRFDIVHHPEHNNRFTHYEIFDDISAFEAHTKMEHTSQFAASVQSLIVNTEVFRGPLTMSVVK